MLLTEWNWDDALKVRKEEGMQKGMRKRAEQIARNMKSAGMDTNTIAKMTGLFVDDILRL